MSAAPPAVVETQRRAMATVDALMAHVRATVLREVTEAVTAALRLLRDEAPNRGGQAVSRPAPARPAARAGACACGSLLPPPAHSGRARKHCSVRCKNKAADDARRERLRTGTPSVGTRRVPDAERVCRWCARSTIARGWGMTRECSACNRTAYRNGRDAEGRPIAKKPRRVGVLGKVGAA